MMLHALRNPSKKVFKAMQFFANGHQFSTDIKSAKIGIIGLGNVGGAIANNLIRNGYNLHSVMDRNPQAMASLPDTIQRCKSPANLAERSEIIITAMPAPPDVKEAMESTEGILNGLQKGAVWIDHTTTDYEQTIRLADRVKTAGADALEAPVTGGMALLKQGKMTVFVGGEKHIFEQCKPLFQLSCANVLYMGEMGSATITKVISNMMAATHTVVMGEALMMAKRCGVDLKSFFDGIRLSAGNSFVFETEAPLVFNGTFHPDFAIWLHCKDLRLGYHLAQKYNVPLPLCALVEQIYNTARIRYGDEAGSSHPPKLLEEAINEKLQIEGFQDWTYTIETVTGGSIGVVHKKK